MVGYDSDEVMKEDQNLHGASARLAQLVERTALNRMVVGSIPTVGTIKKVLVKSTFFLFYLDVFHIQKDILKIFEICICIRLGCPHR